MLLIEYNYKTDIAIQREKERMIALQEGIEQGLVQGETRDKLSTAMFMKQSGFSVEIIAKMTELPIKTIEEL